MRNFNLDNCKFKFTTDTINLFIFLKDKSGSMEGDQRTMVLALEEFKEDFLSFEDKGSVAISNSSFDERTYLEDFSSIEDFTTNYWAGGGTNLYLAIENAVEYTIEYYNEVIKRTNTVPQVTFLCFSDGEDNHYHDEQLRKRAKTAIHKLKEIGTTCVFVAFGNAIKNEDGEMLGFDCIRKITNREELRVLMGKELSKSCKVQSKSASSLGANFFSKVAENENLNSIEEQAINDDSFFDI